MAGMYGDIRDVARAADFAQRARDSAAQYEIRTLEVESQAMYSEFLLWKGHWARAEDAAVEALGSNPFVEALAAREFGTIQARRGRNEARTAIDRMWSQLLGSLEEVLAQGMAIGRPWPSGAFAFWMWKLGLLDEALKGTADFYGWIILRRSASSRISELQRLPTRSDGHSWKRGQECRVASHERPGIMQLD